MIKILLLNGPNLNLLGIREPEIYGFNSFDHYFDSLCREYKGRAELTYYQSNHEGALIDKLHEEGFEVDGIVINAGAYTHTSLAIADAVKAIPATVVEVHISNTHARESFRQHSYLSPVVKGVIFGFGFNSYRLGIEALLAGD